MGTPGTPLQYVIVNPLIADEINERYEKEHSGV